MSRFAALALLCIASLLWACPPSPSAPADNLCAAPEDNTEVISQQGGLSVSQADFDAELSAIPERARARYQQDRERGELINRILLNKALFKKVKEEGLLDDPAVRNSARLAAEKAYVNALFKQLEATAVSDEAVQAHYEENKARFARPMARARHILVKDEQLATDLLSKIKAGDDFAALAEQHSEDRGSKQRGGELPWSTRDRWVKEFGDAAFGLEVNQVSELVKTKYGFHIIQLLEKRDRQPMEEVRPGIERLLSRNAVRDYREAVRGELGLPAPGAARAGKLPPNPHGAGKALKLPAPSKKSAAQPAAAGAAGNQTKSGSAAGK